jgi:hypothetical protein
MMVIVLQSKENEYENNAAVCNEKIILLKN